MLNSSRITKWLKDNTDLDWRRSPGDSPAIKLDSLYINRTEGYEMRDLIVNYYTNCKLEFSDKNFLKTFKKIMKYKKGIKVKREDMLEHLQSSNSNCK